MERRMLVIALFALVACGSGDTASERTTATAPPPSATGGSAAPSPPPVAAAQPAAEEAEMPRESERCLELIAQASFHRALQVCLEALALDPDNEKVQAAVERAKAETGKVAEAAEKAAGAATDAVEDAAGGAQGAADDALGAATERMPGSME